MKQEKKKRIVYPVKRFRMDNQTFRKLERVKKKLNKSWNLTFIEIIKVYDETLH